MSRNVRVALIVFVVTLLWFASGLWKAQNTTEPANPSSSAKHVPVAVAWFEARPYSPKVLARGRTEPNRVVSLRAEVDGRVVAVPAERGQRVTRGDVICQLAKEDRKQRVVQARAAVAEAELEYQGALKLQTRGYQSELAIARSRASLERVRADLKRSETDLANITIRAPFAGVVQSRAVEVGDYMGRADECAVVLETSPLKVVAQISEQQVQQIVPGSTVSVTPVTGGKVTGQISYISQQAAPGTRTYRVEVIIDNPDQQLRAGLSAEILIPVNEMYAQRIPSGLLSLDDEGELGVRVLTDDNRVAFARVQIIGDEPRGVWVLGLPERTRVITVGYEYVANGERVEPTLDDSLMTSGEQISESGASGLPVKQ